ncbi:protein YAE1 homolog [Spea bombifrons]|uniref:protein YAE1 homolog n=1 Tax=Spea bombifrons TaxID=233779 RepID=UPI00234B5B5F|nr:protein YAE1 homolog [Spea bombifrons]
MSWIRAAVEQQEGEEVFDEDGDELSLLQKDWKRSMEKRLKEGYVDGVDAGKGNSLQSGFNQGYKLGVNMIMPYGEIRGTLSALLTWCQLHDPGPAVTTKLNDLLTLVCQCEDHLLRGLSSIYQTPHPSDLSTTLEDIGLASIECGGTDKQNPCTEGRDCCRIQDSHSSPFASCRTIQQLNDRGKHERCRIVGEMLSVVKDMALPDSLVFHIQRLKT